MTETDATAVSSTWRTLPHGASPFSDHALGLLQARREDRFVRLRMDAPGTQHTNSHGTLHGGAMLSLIDMALFATAREMTDIDDRGAVTLDLHNQFTGAAKPGRPVDVVSEVVEETGRMIFLRGRVEQDGRCVSSFIATLRKPPRR